MALCRHRMTKSAFAPRAGPKSRRSCPACSWLVGIAFRQLVLRCAMRIGAGAGASDAPIVRWKASLHSFCLTSSRWQQTVVLCLLLCVTHAPDFEQVSGVPRPVQRQVKTSRGQASAGVTANRSVPEEISDAHGRETFPVPGCSPASSIFFASCSASFSKTSRHPANATPTLTIARPTIPI